VAFRVRCVHSWAVERPARERSTANFCVSSCHPQTGLQGRSLGVQGQNDVEETILALLAASSWSRSRGAVMRWSWRGWRDVCSIRGSDSAMKKRIIC